MLIWIKSEAIKDLSTNYNEIVPALELLATACREGKHIIVGNRDTFQNIANNEYVTGKTKGIYSKLLSQLTQLVPIRSKMSAYIEVIEKEAIPSIDISTDKYIIRLPITFFCDSCNIQQTILLCENLHDAKFYNFIGMAYKHHANLSSLRTNFEDFNGGGQTTGLVYEQKAKSISEERRLVLCILDSDQVAPNTSKGNTAKKVIEVHRNHSSPVMNYCVLGARELENIIPFKFIEESLASDTSKVQAINLLKEFSSNIVLEKAYQFLDIKDGTFVYEITSKVKDPKDIDLWNEILKLRSTLNLGCIDKWTCASPPTKGSKKCSCVISEKLGGNTLESIVVWLEEGKKDTLARDTWNYLSPSQKNEWERIGSHIVSWGVSLSRFSV